MITLAVRDLRSRRHAVRSRFPIVHEYPIAHIGPAVECFRHDRMSGGKADEEAPYPPGLVSQGMHDLSTCLDGSRVGGVHVVDLPASSATHAAVHPGGLSHPAGSAGQHVG